MAFKPACQVFSLKTVVTELKNNETSGNGFSKATFNFFVKTVILHLELVYLVITFLPCYCFKALQSRHCGIISCAYHVTSKLSSGARKLPHEKNICFFKIYLPKKTKSRNKNKNSGAAKKVNKKNI